MVEDSQPWSGTAVGDAGPYSFDDWTEMFRSFSANRDDQGIIWQSGGVGVSPLWVQATGPASASVEITAGEALVDGTYYRNTATVTQAIAPNASGNPRIDTIVLQKIWADQEVRIAVVQGTPGAVPVQPTLTTTPDVTWEIPLADIAVANGFVTITDANITRRASHAIAPSGVYVQLTNNSGGAVTHGTIVEWDSAQDFSFDTTNNLGEVGVIGVTVGYIADGDDGLIIKNGIGYIYCDAAVTRGDRIVNGSVVAGQGTPERAGVAIGRALETTAGAGLCLCLIGHEFDIEGAAMVHRENAGTDGGAMVLATWTTCPVTHVVYDTASIITLAANQIRFRGTGTYEIHAMHVGQKIGNAALRLRNVTLGSNAVERTNWLTTDAGQTHNIPILLTGEFVVTNQGHLHELQMMCDTSRAANGLGVNHTPPDGGDEYYGYIYISRKQ